MKNQRFIYSLLIASAVFSCSKNEEKTDTTYPVIDLSRADAFPIQCSTINRGETITFRAHFSDNAALGSYSLDVHHNFDHHSHSTEVDACDFGLVKTPEKPFQFIKSVEIPGNPSTFEAQLEIPVPNDIDPGDYHFMIRVTDKEGWQTMKGLSIKIQ